ncbi:MAG: class I SAM-dependent methyltransferase [Intrasporangium sp.]|uniref:class I SAM-dependent methyltransferase n=1 Tax=Intrasporangium sp. TaxID=1925024 RepID=UPI002648C7FD|nr:class I SAM-dependent methyltransferase [Intrasporangium sp.]MDN5794453.1 class I SAM-dependent methyltransferase [Intrasporangium sp.]
MSWFYRLAYAIGFTPWDQSETVPGEGDQVLGVLAAQENGEPPPHGRAVDVGCGKGRYSIALAQRGWQVTGVDAVPKALALARQRAQEHRVQVDFVEGDVGRLDHLVAPGADLLLDGGCFHGMSDGDRTRVVRAESEIARSGATLVMVAFHPMAGPGPRGATRDDIVAAYHGWRLVDDVALEIPAGARGPAARARPCIYRLRKL